MNRTEMANMSRDELEVQVLAELSLRDWHDVSTAFPDDPEGAQTFATGTKKGTVFMLTRYVEGEKVELGLVSMREGHLKCVTKIQDHLQWLWEQVTGKETP